MMTVPSSDSGLLGAAPGHFSYSVADDEWDLSGASGLVDSVLGLEPGLPATTGSLLRCQPAEDRARIASVLETAVQDGRPFSCDLHVVDVRRRSRSVLLVGQGERDEECRVRRLTGLVVDLTDLHRSKVQADVDLALERIAEHRGVIEQAKGVLMFATGRDADGAFAVLRFYSSVTNLKLHDVARRLIESVGPQLRASQDSSAAVTALLMGLGGVGASAAHDDTPFCEALTG